MFETNFLSQIAAEYELSPEQEQVFVMRLGDENSYEQIAEDLNTSPDACLKRMGQVYKKLNISGNSRGKENRLRNFLKNKWEQLQQPEGEKTIFSVNSKLNQLKQKSESAPSEAVAQKPKIYQNLPARDYTAFFGRDEEIARLMELLDEKHAAHLISIDGIGGVGKTTLAVEVGYRCYLASQNENPLRDSIPTFDAIIFTSAKENHLTPIGLLRRLTGERTLQDICRQIAYTLNFKEIVNLPLQQQLEQIRHELTQKRTLLIVDNLETIEDKQNLLSFLYDLPPTVKVIITTREQALFVPIRLNFLPEKPALNLIKHQAKEKGVLLSQEQPQQLFEGLSGIPAAIIYAVGQMSAGYVLKDVLERVYDPSGDVARFCFEGSVKSLRDNPPHYLLMALALFVQPVTRKTLEEVAFDKPPSDGCAQAMAKLQQLSLVFQKQGCYEMLELTREYALAELTTHSEFAQGLRQRWVNYYVKFSEAYGETDWKEWHSTYSDLQVEWENLRSVLQWCTVHGRYSDVRTIWQHIKGYIHVRGYWDERLELAGWLIETAKQAGDWDFVVEVMSDRALTLIRMSHGNELEEASVLIEEAWKLRDYQTTEFQLDLATNTAILFIFQEKFDKAKDWLAKQQELLQRVSLSDLERTQQEVTITYYRGQIAFKTKDYQQAKSLFQQALEKATSVKWLRAIAANKNWLANTELELGNLKEARRLLDSSSPMALENEDKRLIAFHQASFARLEKLSSNIQKAKDWAEQAAEGFKSLKMTAEEIEMRSLVETLSN